MSNWTLFSNHGHVLVCLARDSEARLRDVAADVGITERAVQKIVRDLQAGGMLSISKHGRRNRYRIHRQTTLRHDLEAHCTLGDLMRFVLGRAEAGKTMHGRNPQPEGTEREGAMPAGVEPAMKSSVAEKADLSYRSITSSGSVNEKAEAERPELEAAESENTEKRQPRDEEEEDRLPFERQQRSLF